jgi:hypothetical protein
MSRPWVHLARWCRYAICCRFNKLTYKKKVRWGQPQSMLFTSSIPVLGQHRLLSLIRQHILRSLWCHYLVARSMMAWMSADIYTVLSLDYLLSLWDKFSSYCGRHYHDSPAQVSNFQLIDSAFTVKLFTHMSLNKTKILCPNPETHETLVYARTRLCWNLE